MPIVQLPIGELTQGDILKGVPLYVTRRAWTEEAQAQKSPFESCLVVTRPCGIAHKPHVTVAGIAKYSESTPRAIDTFEKALDFITTARDGVTSQDVFYLGQVPMLGPGRFCAKLDALYQIEIPTNPSDKAVFLARNRVASLSIDFARSLHVRLFTSFASLGYDDFNWPTDQDLKWIVLQGQQELAAQNAKVLQIEADRAAKSNDGKQVGNEKEMTDATRKRDELASQLRPYEAELKRRETPTSDLPLDQETRG